MGMSLCNILKKRLVKKRMESYITKVQFLMLNGQGVDISGIVEIFAGKKEDYTVNVWSC